jgi:tRNA A-37 threonylcarbamoyl transferase component Bud32
MTPERWQEIERLYHAALARNQDERAAWLDAACLDDAELRKEVESLLEVSANAPAFLAASALQVTARALASDPPRLVAGQVVGSYEILEPIGAGGMSEVYKARDTRLGRTVAVKVLSPAYADDAVWRQRFERESRALAALSHPHICQVFDVGRDDGVEFLVMEYLEGDTLAARLARGPLPLDQALRHGIAIADALAQAHRRGVLHRDLKPGNIMLTRSGISLLDFGLARLTDDDPSFTRHEPGDETLTREGVILGTLHYMSPEQLDGRPADARSDIFAFGAVLHEMLTGQRAFDGPGRAAVIAAILGQTSTTVSDVQRAAPAALDRVIGKALAKDPDERWQDAGDLRDELKWIADDIAHGTARQATPTLTGAAADKSVPHTARGFVPWALFAGACLALLALAVVHYRQRPAAPAAPPRVTRMTMAASGTAALDIATGRSLAITPDGGRVAYVGGSNQLFVRALDRLDAAAIHSGAAPLTWVFTSPDGQWVGFVEGNVLRKVAITGGPPITIAHTGAVFGATWTPDDSIIFASSERATGLQRVSAAGGAVTVLTRPDPSRGELDHLWPEVLPSGRAVLMTITATTGGLAAAQVAVLDLVTGTRTVLARGGSHGHYLASGHLVYTAEGALRAVAFDLGRLEVRGSPVTVLTRLVTTPQGSGDFVVAADGTLAYVDAPGATAATERTLVWVDRQGREEALAAPPRPYFHPRLSPDGTRVAVAIADEENDIWIWDLARQTSSRVTFDPAADFAPLWTPDGRRLIFFSQRGSEPGLFWQRADGSGSAERLGTGAPPTGVTPGGTHVLFAATGNRDLVMGALDGTHRVEPLLQDPSVERNGIVSPDGRWLAYESDRSGRFEIYVRPFPDVDGGQWLISTAGGTRPLWAPDGKELFHVAPGGAIMASRVDARAGAWSASRPTTVVDGPYATEGVRDRRSYDVSADGRRFLVIKQPRSEATVPQIVVVQQWLEELKRLVPPR